MFRAETDEHKRHVRSLFWEYLQWANAMVGREFGVTFDIETMLEHDLDNPAIYSLPPDRLLLAEHDDAVTGVVYMRRLEDGVGEVKRMYVRPAHRGEVSRAP